MKKGRHLAGKLPYRRDFAAHHAACNDRLISLGATEKCLCVWLKLKDSMRCRLLADGSTQWWSEITNTELSDKARCSVRTVSAAIAWLATHSFVRISPKTTRHGAIRMIELGPADTRPYEVRFDRDIRRGQQFLLDVIDPAPPLKPVTMDPPGPTEPLQKAVGTEFQDGGGWKPASRGVEAGFHPLPMKNSYRKH